MWIVFSSNTILPFHETENDAKYTFQAPCCCFESGLALNLLLFKTINVNIDWVVIKYLVSLQRKIYSMIGHHDVLFSLISFIIVGRENQ